MEKAVLNTMFDNLLHIGNKTNFRNAKMKPYIYGSVNGVHVINLIETSKKIDEVKNELKELTSSGKKILIVATKIQSRDAFKQLAIDTGSFYVCEKWVPGLLTNFKTIKKRIATYLQLLKEVERGDLENLSKKEKAKKLLELEKLNKSYSGLKDIKKLPDVILSSDGIYEKQALKESNILNIKTFTIFNTNGDIDLVSNLIPANTNSVKSFEYLASELRSAFVKSSVTSKPTIRKFEQKKVEVKTEFKTDDKEVIKVEVKKEVKKDDNEIKQTKKPETKD